MSGVVFNTEIFTANISDRAEIPQRMWAYDPHGCLRPNTEFDLPVMCQVQRPYPAQRLGSQGVEYDTFEKCCPNRNYPNQINQWAQINTCQLQVCFTNNETLAAEFDRCIYETAKAKSNITNDRGGSSYRGRCEWIDFDNLKRGIRDSDDIDSFAPAQRLLSWVLLTVTLTAAMLGPAIG